MYKQRGISDHSVGDCSHCIYAIPGKLSQAETEPTAQPKAQKKDGKLGLSPKVGRLSHRYLKCSPVILSGEAIQ